MEYKTTHCRPISCHLFVFNGIEIMYLSFIADLGYLYGFEGHEKIILLQWTTCW